MRFGNFEIDESSEELRQDGELVKMAPRQFRLLHFLARNPGRLVTRAEIQKEIWGEDTFVDFDRNLNVCVAQLRAALGDDSESPRYIETVPRKGYRFLAKVDADPAPAEPASLSEPVSASVLGPAGNRPFPAIAALTVLGVLAAGAIIARQVLSPATSPSARIAVIPITSASLDDAPFIDGLTAELMSAIGSQSARISVLGRASVTRSKDVARELHPDYIVEGSLRHDGAKTRISVGLTRVRDQVQVWTETFERDKAGSFELQEDVAARVAAGVLRNLFPEEHAMARPARGVAEAAYQAYLNGRYMQQKTGLRRSIPYFEDAIAASPDFAEAHAALAETYVSLGHSGSSPDGFTRARPEAQAALRLDPANAEAHNALGNVLFYQDWNWSAAEREFQAAIDANPSFARAHHDQAFFLVAMGRREAALTALRRAMALDPLSVRVNIDAGWLLLQAHHFDDAIVQTKRALELEPGLREAEACQARARALLGQSAPADATSSFMHAAYLAMGGQSTPSIDALEKAYAEHAPMMVMLQSEPAFDKLRSDPRFQALAAKMRFP